MILPEKLIRIILLANKASAILMQIRSIRFLNVVYITLISFKAVNLHFD